MPMAVDGVQFGAGVVGATVTVAEPVFVSLVATIVAVPDAIACTVPVGVTLAFVGSELDHVICRPVSVAPLASVTTAVICWVAPIASVTVFGETLTLATGTVVTVNAACPECPSNRAMMFVVPGA